MAVDTLTPTCSTRRATVRPDKADAVAELAEAFRGSSAAVLTEYRGLTVKQISELRVALGADTTYAVVKNTLTKIAAARRRARRASTSCSPGPTAVAFIKGDPVEAAKALRDFAKANPALVVKGGVMDGKALTADEIKQARRPRVARGPARPSWPARCWRRCSNAVHLFNAPLAQAARLAGALQAKAEARTRPSSAEAPARRRPPPRPTRAEAAADEAAAAEAAAAEAAAAEAAARPRHRRGQRRPSDTTTA